MRREQDAFGLGLLEYLEGKRGCEIIERDDGLVEPSGGPKFYFAEHMDWTPREKKAIRYARGRVLDVGCGAGRCLLHLQSKGLEVVGIDNSPLAVEVCRKRGALDVRLLSVTRIGRQLGRFDTVLMFGGNFGLVANPDRARWLFKRFYGLTTARGRIIAGTVDPYQTKDRIYLDYHKLNRKRGRMAGQIRLRVRYKQRATPWFDWLIVSKKEMARILEDTGWRIRRTFAMPGGFYTVVIEKSTTGQP